MLGLVCLRQYQHGAQEAQSTEFPLSRVEVDWQAGIPDYVWHLHISLFTEPVSKYSGTHTPSQPLLLTSYPTLPHHVKGTSWARIGTTAHTTAQVQPLSQWSLLGLSRTVVPASVCPRTLTLTDQI